MPLHALLEGPTTTGIASGAPRAFRRLFGTRLSTLEREINQAAAQGFRVTAAMGGDVLLERSEDATVKHAYRLVAAGGLPTLVRDVRQAGREGYRVVPATTVLNAVVLERSSVRSAVFEYAFLDARVEPDRLMTAFEKNGFVVVSMSALPVPIVILEKG